MGLTQMIDLKIYKTVGYDRYCGGDMLCVEGGELAHSALLWLLIIGVAFVAGAILGGKRK